VRRRRSIDPPIQAALIGLEAQRERTDEQIAQVKVMLGGRGKKVVGPTATSASKKRVLSAAARKRIAGVQRKRWAEWRKCVGSA
jgi:hypothetical protein